MEREKKVPPYKMLKWRGGFRTNHPNLGMGKGQAVLGIIAPYAEEGRDTAFILLLAKKIFYSILDRIPPGSSILGSGAKIHRVASNKVTFHIQPHMKEALNTLTGSKSLLSHLNVSCIVFLVTNCNNIYDWYVVIPLALLLQFPRWL